MKQHTKGLTLVELMITIVIAGILITVGVPSMTSMYEGYRADSGIRVIQSSITFARSQAVSYGARVTVCPLTGSSCGTNWKDGFSIFLDRDGDLGKLEGDDRVIKVIESFNSKDFVSFTSGSISFSTDGLVIGNSGTFAYCPASKTNEYSKGAEVSLSGHIKFIETAVTCS